MKGYFEVRRVDIEIKPTSAARATVFWFLFGTNPYKVKLAVYGELEYCLPRPFLYHQSLCGITNFWTEGRERT